MPWTTEKIPADTGQSFLHTATAGVDGPWAFGISVQRGEFGTLAFHRRSDGWSRVDVPQIGRANQAVVVSSSELWVVGDGTSLHHVDGEWHVVPAATVRQPVQLFGLAAFGSDVWTAGYAPAEDQRAARGSVQRWDGAAWVDQVLPDVAAGWSLAGLGGVAADDLWAVGAVFGESAVALHRDGSVWERVALPDNENVKLVDVLALGSYDVWAAGYRSGRGRKPVALHWDGSTWSSTPLPGEGGQVQALVAGADRLWCVGYAGSGPYVAEWDGAEWRSVPGPEDAGFLHGAALTPDGRLLVVGAVDERPYAAVLD